MKHRSAEASRYIAAAAWIIGILAAVASAQTVPVTVTFHAGRVTLTATDAPAADVLQEWARIGKVEVSGAEPLSMRRVTLNLADVEEQKALEQIVGAGYGFLGIGKSDPLPDTSHFGRLIIVSTGSASTAASPPTTAGRPDPETTYEYSRPRNATMDPANYGGVGIGATTANLGEMRTDPERAFDYSVPSRVREAVERQRQEAAAKPAAAKAPPPSTNVPYVEPELRFNYYRPLKSIPPRQNDKNDPATGTEPPAKKSGSNRQ